MHYISLQILPYDNQNHVTINLQSYLHQGLEDTGMAECRSVSTPIDAKNRLVPRGLDEEVAHGGTT